VALVLGAVVAVAVLVTRPSDAATPWARLGTADVHSLAFVEDDPNHVLFGHHAGILESRDGGRTWQPLPIGADAMGMRPAEDGSIIIAGHLVFTASHDNGKTWAPIAAQDLPNLDIHGFARDPSDPARMWAALATGGLWESSDFGIHWERVSEDNVLLPIATRSANTTRLIAIGVGGLEASDDGGRSWRSIPTPPTYPMTALAATPDGKIMYAGSLDRLYRSDDAGRSWSATSYKGSAFAIATSDDGGTVALVSQDTEYFRSTDGGQTWPGPA
jgi:photosystem II stability/assembly factor-like uncharacterized protein